MLGPLPVDIFGDDEARTADNAAEPMIEENICLEGPCNTLNQPYTKIQSLPTSMFLHPSVPRHQ